MKRLSRVFSGSPKPIPSEDGAAPKESNAAPTNPKPVLVDRSIDEARPLRVVVIGAGISGILACIRFVQRIPNLDLCIYDKNADVGGTWFENRYPGCACGRDCHVAHIDGSCRSHILDFKTSQHTLTKLPLSPIKNGPHSMRAPPKSTNIGSVLPTSTGV